MFVRQAMLIVNIAIFALVLGLTVLFQSPGYSNPEYATYLFYVLLVWIVASLFIYRLPVMNRRIGSGPSAPGPLPTGAPSGPAPSAAPAELGFCIHCGTMVAPGTVKCPSCGRFTSS